MTIKGKIRLSNILMVLVPIAVVFVAVTAFRRSSFGDYWYFLEQMYQDENGIQSAQSLIYTYQQELWENNWGQRKTNQETKTGTEEGSCGQGQLRQSSTMHHLEQKLDRMGYHILVKKNGTALYSNLSDEDLNIASNTAGDALWTAKMLTISQDNVSVIKNTFFHDEKEFSIIAVNTGQSQGQVESYLRNYIFKYMLFLFILFFLITLVVNWILSWWLSRSVLIPLGKLRQGARRIREGDLDTPADCGGQDEFGEVCRDFEEMRMVLKKSVEQRLENEQKRREMINGVSHDLRTPLTSIGGYVDGLLEGIADTPQKRERYLKAIKTRTRDLERLVDSLSEYSRLDSGQMKYDLKQGDLKEFVVRYLEANQEEAGRSRVSIKLEAREERYPLKYDREEMKRVLDNLFTNTVRYRQSPASQVLIRIENRRKEGVLRMEVKDDGPGVPQESLPRIFDTFYRTDSARSQAGRGSGIGLAVVREIVTGHGGRVWAENDGGLKIIMEFPCDDQKEKGERS